MPGESTRAGRDEWMDDAPRGAVEARSSVRVRSVAGGRHPLCL